MLALYLSLCSSEDESHKVMFIYDNYYRLMYAAAYDIVQDPEVLPDIMQDTLVKLIRNSATIRIEGGFPLKNYVTRAAKNAAIDYLRVMGGKGTLDIDDLPGYQEAEDPSASVPELLISRENYNQVVQCIHALPDTYRDACNMRYLYGMDDKAIAEELHISYDNAAMRVHRGRKLLQKMIAEVRKNEE